MLKPATPLTVLFGTAFILLLLSTISTPIVKSIPLGQYEGYNFGVFGFCGPNNCTRATVGYYDGMLNTTAFTLPSTQRHTLSSILVVHPVAALMTLICTGLAGAAHVRSPAHSPRYLLGLLIFSFPTLFISLLAFLVDVLLFIPHLQWAGWIVLAATIILTLCSVLTCAMRRTLVSRKARKRRIAENADMNGQTYYETRAEHAFARADSPPPMNGDHDKKQFATYEFEKPRSSNDDRIPLRAQAPSVRSVGTNQSGGRTNGNKSFEAARPPLPSHGSADFNHENDRPVSPIEYEQQDYPEQRFRDQERGGRGGAYGPNMWNNRGGPGGPPRGRGGPAPRGRPPPRGGNGFPPPRGNYRGAYRGARGPPPGWAGNGAPFRPGPPEAAMGAGMATGPMAGRGPRPPPGYLNGYPQEESYEMYDRRPRPEEYQRPPPAHIPGQWPDPLANPYEQAISPLNEPPAAGLPFGRPPVEFDQRNSPGPVSPPQTNAQQRHSPDGVSRDPASFGFSGRRPSAGSASNQPRGHFPAPPMPEMDGYGVMPGQAIEMDASSGNPAHGVHELADMNTNHSTWHADPVELPAQGRSTTGDVPVELPAHAISVDGAHTSPPSTAIKTRPRAPSDHYYEDVDPRFASHEDSVPLPPQQPQTLPAAHASPLPTSLMPGGAFAHNRDISSNYSGPERNDTRSPAAESEGSNFTSVSQRGVNPRWQPPPGEFGNQGYGVADARYGPLRQPRPQNDAILAENPDFAVPGVGPSTRGGSGGRGVGQAIGHARGLSGGAHRYPTDAI